MFGWVMKLSAVRVWTRLRSTGEWGHILSLVSVLETHYSDSFHKAANAVPQELAARLQRSVYADVVFGGKEKVGGLGGVV
jgi:hypothetical protein